MILGLTKNTETHFYHLGLGVPSDGEHTELLADDSAPSADATTALLKGSNVNDGGDAVATLCHECGMVVEQGQPSRCATRHIGGPTSFQGRCKFSLEKHKPGMPHELKRTMQTLSGAREKTSSETTTSTTTPTQAKQSGARAALHKDHAANGNDVKKSGRLNEGKQCEGTKINPKKKPCKKKE